MGYIDFDPDEYEAVTESRPCTCGGKCNGRCNGMFSQGWRRRSPEEIAAIKRKARKEYEDRILAQAERIKALRGIP
jgi:hypothetical protein